MKIYHKVCDVTSSHLRVRSKPYMKLNPSQKDHESKTFPLMNKQNSQAYSIQSISKRSFQMDLNASCTLRTSNIDDAREGKCRRVIN